MNGVVAHVAFSVKFTMSFFLLFFLEVLESQSSEWPMIRLVHIVVFLGSLS